MKDKKIESKEIATQDIRTIMASDELAKLYNDNAKLGAENLGGSSPLLKVHTVGKSTANELADGGTPHDGYFFYKPTGEEFESVDCHILKISAGFKTDGMADKKQYNQILS